MKKVKKAFFCLLTMLFFVNLISCNHVSQGEVGKNYKEKSIVEGWKQAAISCLCAKDEALYFSTFEDVGELNGELTSHNRLYVIKENKTQPEEISFWQYSFSSTYFCNFSFNNCSSPAEATIAISPIDVSTSSIASGGASMMTGSANFILL